MAFDVAIIEDVVGRIVVIARVVKCENSPA